MWRSFEEAELLDSSGSEFNGGDEDSDDSSPNVSLVDESKLEGEREIESRKVYMRREIIHGQDRRQRRKAICDGVILGGHVLKGEKGKCVSIRGRCILEYIFSIKS